MIWDKPKAPADLMRCYAADARERAAEGRERAQKLRDQAVLADLDAGILENAARRYDRAVEELESALTAAELAAG